MKPYRKLPVIIYAEQFTGDSEQATRLGMVRTVTATGGLSWFIHTLEGFMIVEQGSWVIRGVKGELYPCKDEIFKLTYEPS